MEIDKITIFFFHHSGAVQQNRHGTTLRRWSLSRAWPVKFVAGDWDNESDEKVIEHVTLTFDFFELIQQGLPVSEGERFEYVVGNGLVQAIGSLHPRLMWGVSRSAGPAQDRQQQPKSGENGS